MAHWQAAVLVWSGCLLLGGCAPLLLCHLRRRRELRPAPRYTMFGLPQAYTQYLLAELWPDIRLLAQYRRVASPAELAARGF